MYVRWETDISAAAADVRPLTIPLALSICVDIMLSFRYQISLSAKSFLAGQPAPTCAQAARVYHSLNTFEDFVMAAPSAHGRG